MPDFFCAFAIARSSSRAALGKALALALLIACAPAREVELRAPLSTIVHAESPVPEGDGAVRVEADLTVPADAPRDLGVGAFVVDPHGRWWQQPSDESLTPGRHRFTIVLAPGAAAGEPQREAFDVPATARAARAGVFLWSASASRASVRVRVDRLTVGREPLPRTRRRLLDVSLGGVDADGVAHARAGERWTLTARAQPTPSDPFDDERFRLDAHIDEPDGHARDIPGFWWQPMRGEDRGDREVVVPDGAGRYALRFRPRAPGAHRVRVTATWDGKAESFDARLVVDGERTDPYARVDAKDPRFFAVDGAFWWPIGLNLRSIADERCRDRLGTKMTPVRGTRSYDAYFARLAAAGGDACEIWMCSWNLAIEWRGDWPGFAGVGRYSDENAWRLDRVLDAAWADGVRIDLVVHNHGQTSDRTDHEWENSPYNRAHGGKLTRASDWFTSDWALAREDRLHRYLVARYGDHPALWLWKLYSEVNLTAGEQQAVRVWHERTEARFHALDSYGHPVTTHWSGNWLSADPAIVAQPGLDAVCIDAYHQGSHDGGQALADLLFQGTQQPNRGLARFRKPIVVTEYGGNWDACPPPQLEAEHATSTWCALVSGYGGAPMLWWFEWVDQGNHWQPYGAIRRFLAGEDLRGADARSVEPAASTPFNELWVHAWSRPGRMLGYVLDRAWQQRGGEAPTRSDVRLELGSSVAAGAIEVEWWDADRGERLSSEHVDHPGGALAITAPPFSRHIAFKVARP